MMFLPVFFLIFFIKHTSLRCNTLMCHARRNWVKAWSYLNPMAIVSCGDEISISSLILRFEQPRNSSVFSSPLTYFASSARTMTSNFTKGRFHRGRFFCTTIVRGCTLSISPWSAGKYLWLKFSAANFLSDSSMIWKQIGSKSIVNSQCIKNYSGQTHYSNCYSFWIGSQGLTGSRGWGRGVNLQMSVISQNCRHLIIFN